MNQSNEVIECFMTAVADCHEQLRTLAQDFRRRPDILMVTHWLDLPKVESGFRIEEFVDAERSDGKAISWRLEVTMNANDWSFECDIRINHDAGQDVIERLTVKNGTNVDDAIAEMYRLTRALINRADLIQS